MELGLSLDKKIKSFLTGNIVKDSPINLAPKLADKSLFLDLERSQLEKYLGENPAEAEQYFKMHSEKNRTHGAVLIEKRGETYWVFREDDGKYNSEKSFPSLVAAVVEHIVITNGIQ